MKEGRGEGKTIIFVKQQIILCIMEWVSFLWNVLIGIGSGIVSGIISGKFVLRYFIQREKPQISISPNITQSIGSSGLKQWGFKFVNNSLAEVYNVKVEVVRFTIKSNINQTNLVNQSELFSFECLSIPKKETDDRYESHAQIVNVENSQTVWIKDTYIQLIVVATHGVSGMTQVFRETYSSENCLKQGEFKSGDSFEIINI